MSEVHVILHARLLSDETYFAVSRSFMMSMTKGSPADGTLPVIGIEHDDDNTCCHREPWPLTQARLIGDKLPIAVLDVREAGPPII